jgi:hypothetical protein
MNNQTFDWRANFRLHTLDLDAKLDVASASESHWMLREKGFLRMLTTLEKDYLKLCSLGGDPFNGGEITPEGILAKLGFDKRSEPSGFLASGQFMSSFVVACCRETNKVYGEMERLRQAARPGRWFARSAQP